MQYGGLCRTSSCVSSRRALGQLFYGGISRNKVMWYGERKFSSRGGQRSEEDNKEFLLHSSSSSLNPLDPLSPPFAPLHTLSTVPVGTRTIKAKAKYVEDTQLDNEIKDNLDKEQYLDMLKLLEDQKKSGLICSDPVLLEVMEVLHNKKYYRYIYQIYSVYGSLIAKNKRLIELAILSSFHIKKFQEIDPLFNRYLAFNDQDVDIIKISLACYIRSRNANLARELFYQLISSRDDLDESFLEVMLEESVINRATLSIIKFCYHSWISSTNDLPVSDKAYGLYLFAHLRFGTDDEIASVYDVIREKGRSDCIDVRFYEYYDQLIRCPIVEKMNQDEYDPILEKFKQLVLEIRADDRLVNAIFLETIKTIAVKHDLLRFSKVMRYSKELEITPSVISYSFGRYFLSVGKFEHFVKYLEGQKEAGGEYDTSFLSSLYTSFRLSYPDYLDVFYEIVRAWYSMGSSSYLKRESMILLEEVQNKWVSRNSKTIDNENLLQMESHEIINYFKSKSSEDINSVIRGFLRSGTAPPYHICHAALKRLIPIDPDSAINLQNLMKSWGLLVPFKINIYWIQEKLKGREAHGVGGGIGNAIKQIGFQNDVIMNTQNKLHLASFAYKHRELKTALALSEGIDNEELNLTGYYIKFNIVLHCHVMRGEYGEVKELLEDFKLSDVFLTDALFKSLYSSIRYLRRSEEPEAEELIGDITEFIAYCDERRKGDQDHVTQILKRMVMVLKDWV